MDRPFACVGHCSLQLFTGIAPIRKHVPQPREAVADAGQHVRCTVAVLNIGCMNDGTDQQALRVGDDVPLSSLYLFASIIASRPAALGGLDALAIDDTGA